MTRSSTMVRSRSPGATRCSVVARWYGIGARPLLRGRPAGAPDAGAPPAGDAARTPPDRLPARTRRTRAAEAGPGADAGGRPGRRDAAARDRTPDAAGTPPDRVPDAGRHGDRGPDAAPATGRTAGRAAASTVVSSVKANR